MCSIHSNQKYFCTFCLEKSEVIGHYTLNCPNSVCKECGVNEDLKKKRPKLLFKDGFRKSIQTAKKETSPIKQKVILESDVNFEYKAKLKPKFNTHYHTKTLPSLSWKTGPKPKNDRSHGIFGQRRFDMEKIKRHSELFNETNREQFDYANKTKSHGFGEKMLKKMGWSEGDGLGRVSYDFYELHTVKILIVLVNFKTRRNESKKRFTFIDFLTINNVCFFTAMLFGAVL